MSTLTISKTKTITIEQVLPTDIERLNECYQLQKAIFQEELNLYDMIIPDTHDSNAIYLAMMDEERVVGTCRIVMPNKMNRFPIQDIGFKIEEYHLSNFCEWSRLVFLKEYRGKRNFQKMMDAFGEATKANGLSTVIVEILPRNLSIFKKYGFTELGPALFDPTCQTDNPADAFVVPMKLEL